MTSSTGTVRSLLSTKAYQIRSGLSLNLWLKRIELVDVSGMCGFNQEKGVALAENAPLRFGRSVSRLPCLSWPAFVTVPYPLD